MAAQEVYRKALLEIDWGMHSTPGNYAVELRWNGLGTGMEWNVGGYLACREVTSSGIVLTGPPREVSG